MKSSQSCVKWLCIIFLSLSSTLQCDFFSDVNRCNAALSRLPGNCYARRENLQPSSHQHSGGLGSPLQTAASLFASPKQAEVERSVSPVAELNAEMREGRLVRDVTSHRGGPAADLISSSWLQRREDADLITARLSPCCDALSRIHGSSSFFFQSVLAPPFAERSQQGASGCALSSCGCLSGVSALTLRSPPKGELMRR